LHHAVELVAKLLKYVTVLIKLIQDIHDMVSKSESVFSRREYNDHRLHLRW
jgi:hypothetical protein